jgi:hypothetical protein
MSNLFRDWYKEDDKSESKCPSESGVEIFLFYINLLLLVVFSIIVLCSDTLHRRYLVLFIPTLIWIFLRSSRKDMTATAHWVAGLLGAIGGAGSVLLLRIFLK